DDPPPAAAEPKTLPVPTRVHLIGETAVIVGTPQRGWDEEGPDAHNCDDMGCATIGPHVLARVPFTDERDLSQQPEARGVVDVAAAKRAVAAVMSAPDGISVEAFFRIVLEAALATKHQEPTT